MLSPSSSFTSAGDVANLSTITTWGRGSIAPPVSTSPCVEVQAARTASPASATAFGMNLAAPESGRVAAKLRGSPVAVLLVSMSVSLSLVRLPVRAGKAG